MESRKGTGVVRNSRLRYFELPTLTGFLGYVRTITVLLWLLIPQNGSSPFANESKMTAIELLTAFSGESAEQYEPFFRYSAASEIVGIEIYAIGMNNTTATYSGKEGA